jgi:hypothetical protein
MEKRDFYYALCVDGDIAALDLGYEEGYGGKVGLTVYTSPIGEIQQEDMAKWEGATRILPVSLQELLTASGEHCPTSVFIDGKKVAGSTFREMIKSQLGLPIRLPRPVRLDGPSEAGNG